MAALHVSSTDACVQQYWLRHTVVEGLAFLCVFGTMRCAHCMMEFKNQNSLAAHSSKYKGQCLQEMTDSEYELLQPVIGNQAQVKCKECEWIMSKRSIFNHLSDCHPELWEQSWNWLIKGQ